MPSLMHLTNMAEPRLNIYCPPHQLHQSRGHRPGGESLGEPAIEENGARTVEAHDASAGEEEGGETGDSVQRYEEADSHLPQSFLQWPPVMVQRLPISRYCCQSHHAFFGQRVRSNQ